MKNIITKLCLIAVLGMTAVSTMPAQEAKTWEVDKAHTFVVFEIGHFFSTVNGRFNEFDGDFKFHPEDLSNSSFTFKVKAESIDTGVEKRDNHLRSEDFFHAEKYPEIVFASERIEKRGRNDYVVHGDLSIRGTTKRVAVPFVITGERDHPMQENTRLLGLSFNTQLSRTAYNVGKGDWASTAVVGDDVFLKVNMELTRKK